MQHPVIAWILTALHFLLPYDASSARAVAYRFTPDATVDAHLVRMSSIAADALDVVRSSEPLPGLSRESTLRLVLSVAYFESGFQKDVDFGLGKWGKGDGGKAFCLMQLETGGENGTVPISDPVIGAWTGKDLVTDRKKCFKAGLEAMRRSMRFCATQKDGDERLLRGSALLSAYTSGKCQANEPAARSRWQFARGKVLGRPMPKIEPKVESAGGGS